MKHSQLSWNYTEPVFFVASSWHPREDIRNKPGVSARMSRGCYEKTAVVEIRVEAGWRVHYSWHGQSVSLWLLTVHDSHHPLIIIVERIFSVGAKASATNQVRNNTFKPHWNVCHLLCTLQNTDSCKLLQLLLYFRYIYFASGEVRVKYCNVSVLGYLKNHTTEPHQFSCMLPVAVPQSFSGGVAIFIYLLPVLSMTSCLQIMGPMARNMYTYDSTTVRPRRKVATEH